MFASAIKINASTNLMRLSDFCVNHNNLISHYLFSLIRFVISSLSKLRLYRIISVNDYCSGKKNYYETLAINRIGYAWTSSSNLHNAKPIEGKGKMPDLTLSLLKNVVITSNSDLIIDFKDDVVINDYCAEKKDNNKTYVDGITLSYWGKCCLVRLPKQEKEISKGIMLSGKFAFNYYHNIFENLIRFLLIEEFNEKIPQEVPVLLDSETLCTPSLHQIVDYFRRKTKRQILDISEDFLYKVENLYYFSNINQLTPQHVDASKGNACDYLFDREYIKEYSKELLGLKSDRHFPSKIFITRSNVKKRNFNEDDVFSVLKPLGFAKIAPEELPIEDQIALFNEAKVIIGGSGAAFTNMLFASKGCKALIIVGRGGNPSSCFNSPAFINGAEISFYQCTDKLDKSIHANFVVNKNDFELFLKTYLFHQST